MTKKELEQLTDLKKEIRELEERILKIQQMDIKSAPVKVDASGKNFPYIQGSVTVSGYDPAIAGRRDKMLYEKKILLDERRKNAEDEEKRLMQYINGIKESRVRRIMQYRYIDGYSWERIGGIMHFDRRTGERIINRYLQRQKNPEKNKNCPQCPF